MTETALNPTLTPLPFNDTKPDHFVHTISNLFSEFECNAIIQQHKNLTESNITPGTIRTRQQFEDFKLAERVWERLRGFYEGEEGEGRGGRVRDQDGEWWRVSGLNERWRLCLYEKGVWENGMKCEGRKNMNFANVVFE